MVPVNEALRLEAQSLSRLIVDSVGVEDPLIF